MRLARHIRRRTDAIRSFSAPTMPVAKRHDWLSTLEDADVANLRARCSKIIEGADAKPYNKDWMNKWEGQARIVAQPASTEEVSAVLAYCDARRLAVTTQGGKTGLVGGSVPVHDEVILSTTRLNTIEGLDADTGVVTCGSACVAIDFRAPHAIDATSSHTQAPASSSRRSTPICENTAL
jgi:D-2-hydroxyglutarate dehydrogenase